MNSSFFRAGVAPAIIVSLLLSLAAPLAASADDGDADVAAAPVAAGVGVARLSVVDGDVAIQRGDSNTTVAAAINAPVLGADYLTTGADSRAEVEYDGNTVVRLGQNVQARFSHIDTDNRTVQLAAGSIDVRLLHDTDGTTSIDTPSISVVPRSAGSYRVDVDADGTTDVTVRSGHADIVTPSGTQPLESGVTLVASGPASDPTTQQTAELAYDSFDAFNHDRDGAQAQALAQAPYVNGNIDGVADLGQYGHWVPDASYGQVWIPNDVPADWAPYRNGNWTWADSYGWTWVAVEPWGWAPYHYGRWYYSSAYRHWAWFPPRPAIYAPAWSPALVGFVGFNIGAVNVGIGFGNVGWVPLAPYEAFHPWWGHGVTNVTNVNVNITRNVYVNNTVNYRNLEVHNAMTSVTMQNFQAGRFSHPIAVSNEELRSYHPVAVRGALPIVPTEANLRYSDRAVPAVAVRQAAFTRTFAGSQAVTPRTSFRTQQATVARTQQLPLPEARPAGAAAYGREAAAPSYAHATAASNDPWSRFNAYHGTNAAPQAAARPQGGTPSYARPESSAYSRAAVPSYARPEGQAYARPATSTYARPSSPYVRPASPAYARSAAPAYRAAAPSRPAPAAAHASHGGGDDRRDR